MRHSLLALACAALLLSACASTHFRAYEGAGVVQGKGGVKAVHDGIEIWDLGDPPRRFRLVGVNDAERGGGVIPMSQMRSDVVRKAREAGGDALIQLRSAAQIVGYQTIASGSATSTGYTTSATGYATAIPLRRNYATFPVIRYAD
jgi:hypothetical protein